MSVPAARLFPDALRVTDRSGVFAGTLTASGVGGTVPRWYGTIVTLQ